jgi:uncharacterized protein YbcV (DUF1398 family)
MEQHTLNIIEECAIGAHEGTIRFPDIVAKLLEIGVEQYHADFLRAETTYYLSSGESHVVALSLPDEPIAQEFSAEAVAAAVQASQKEGIHYQEFLLRAMKAGCVGYVVYLDGQRVVYCGRKGDMHIEHFPGSRVVTSTDD